MTLAAYNDFRTADSRYRFFNMKPEMDMQEFSAITELLIMLIVDPRMDILFALLIAASVVDCRTYRIPNYLTFPGTVIGLILAIVMPFSVQHGFLWSVGGLAVGLLATLPFYALKTMGAGDVKLMAMVGAFIGLSDIAHAVIFTFIVGGVAGLSSSLLKGSFGRMLGNIKSMYQIMMLSATQGGLPDMRIPTGKSAGRFPYGPSISVGTIGSLVAKQLGYL